MKSGSMFYEALVSAVADVLDLPVNVNRFSHADIVEALYEIVHDGCPATALRPSVRICHGDGSESVPIRLRRFGTAPEWDVTVRPLRVGFVSGRHVELDRIVDFYLLRNSEIRQFDSSADLEQEVFDRAVRLFGEAADAGYTHIEAIHTGLEAVTLGFYRGVIEHAHAQRESGHPMLLRSRIWNRDPHLVVGTFVTTSGDPSEWASLEKALERIAVEAPEWLRFERVPSEAQPTVSIHWLPERPMLASERDWLARRARQGARAIEVLFRRAQYRDGRIWVVQ